MKTTKCFFIFIASFVIIFFPGCASGPHKAAMDYAASVNFDFDPQTNAENLCVILCRENAFIETIDGIQQDNTVVLPGTHYLAVQYSYSSYSSLGRQTITRSSSSELIPVVFTFEPGKHYYLDYTIAGDDPIMFNAKLRKRG